MATEALSERSHGRVEHLRPSCVMAEVVLAVAEGSRERRIMSAPAEALGSITRLVT